MPVYIDVIAPENRSLLEEMVEKALSLGFGAVGVVGSPGDLPEGAFRVSVVKSSEIPHGARKLRGASRLLIAVPRSLEEARRSTFSKLVDGVMASYDTARPNFDYVCARQLKRNEGTLFIPVVPMVSRMLGEPRVIRNVRLEVRIALHAGLYPMIASMARRPEEVVPPRLLVSFGEFMLDLRREQAKAMVKDFPSYMISGGRRLRVRGVVTDEIQDTD